VYHGFHWDEAQKSLVRALELDPHWDRGHHAYAEFLKVRGRTNEAVAKMREALRCNPQSVRVRQRFPYVLVAARRYDEAIKEAEDAITMEPNTVSSAYHALVVAWCARGHYVKAIEAERRLLHAARTSQEKAGRLIGELQQAFEAEGAKGYWRMKLERAKQADADPYELATMYAQLGKRAQALDCLRTCLQEQAFGLIWMVKVDWQLDPLRSDPGFQDILKQMNLE
jgi:tetratricopeptide (TPR) repeat protein